MAYNIIMEEDSEQLKQFNEMTVMVYDSLPTEVENSVFYPKLKQLLHLEIVRFCKEQYDLKMDLQAFRQLVGEALTEDQIREYMDNIKAKYNNMNTNVGVQYHIESTRIDYACIVFVCIKRDNIYMKKFVFRFKKAGGIGVGMNGLGSGGLIDPEYDD